MQLGHAAFFDRATRERIDFTLITTGVCLFTHYIVLMGLAAANGKVRV